MNYSRDNWLIIARLEILEQFLVLRITKGEIKTHFISYTDRRAQREEIKNIHTKSNNNKTDNFGRNESS